MSVLVFHNASLAAKAAAMVAAAELIQRPSSVFGLDCSEELFPVYHQLAEMSKDGILDWSELHSYALTEAVRSEGGFPLSEKMHEKLFRYTNIPSQSLHIPPVTAEDWSIACNAYEDDILNDGGMDLLILHIEKDGSLAYNYGATELAPITHVERALSGRVVTVGITTILSSRKIVALMTGDDKSELARRIFSGPITPLVPASYLQLHANTVFLLDEAAAKFL